MIKDTDKLIEDLNLIVLPYLNAERNAIYNRAIQDAIALVKKQVEEEQIDRSMCACGHTEYSHKNNSGECTVCDCKKFDVRSCVDCLNTACKRREYKGDCPVWVAPKSHPPVKHCKELTMEEIKKIGQKIPPKESFDKLSGLQFKEQRVVDPCEEPQKSCESSSEHINSITAHNIAQNQALHSEAQHILEDSIFSALQVAQKRGEVLERVHRLRQPKAKPCEKRELRAVELLPLLEAIVYEIGYLPKEAAISHKVTRAELAKLEARKG